MKELISKIEKWANDRNIIKGSKPIDQAMKLFSEFGELADNVGKGRDCRDDIGDIFVVLVIMAKQLDSGMIVKMNKVFQNVAKDIKNNESQHYGEVTNVTCGVKEKVAFLASNVTLFINHLYDCRVDFYSTDDLIEKCLVCLFAICNDLDYKFNECVKIAHNDIKDRNGVMHNGVFIKESDPVYQSIVKFADTGV